MLVGWLQTYWLEQLASRDERASTAHQGNPPPRTPVEDSGQSGGHADRIAVACGQQFEQLCNAFDTFRRDEGITQSLTARNMSARLLSLHSAGSHHLKRRASLQFQSGPRACLGEFRWSIVVHCTLDLRCDLTYTTSSSPAQKTHFHPRFTCSVHSPFLHGYLQSRATFRRRFKWIGRGNVPGWWRPGHSLHAAL